MKRLDDRTVELTDVEQVVSAWHDSLLNGGMGIQAATEVILASAPTDQPDHPLNRLDPDFLVYVSDGTVLPH